MIKHIKKLIGGGKVLEDSKKQQRESEKAIENMKATLNGENYWFMCVRKCMDECEEKK